MRGAQKLRHQPMSHWGVELVIGKLLTDHDFRRRFEQRRRACLLGVREHGIDLDDLEIDALIEADPAIWSKLAARIDQRLQHRRVRPGVSARRAPRPLTEREQHVLRGVFEGQTNKQIAAHVGVSEAAVKGTIQHLFRKRHVRTRAQLVRVAIEESLDAAHRGR